MTKSNLGVILHENKLATNSPKMKSKILPAPVFLDYPITPKVLKTPKITLLVKKYNK